MKVQQEAMMLYRESEEYPHTPTDEEHFSNSVYFNFFDPKNKLGGTLRVGLRPNLNYSECLFNIPIVGGPVLFQYLRGEIETTREFACEGMTVRVESPFERLELTFSGEVILIDDPTLLATDTGYVFRELPRRHCRLDLKWESNGPIHTVTPERDMAEGAVPLARDHYEQFGWLTGTLSVGDETYEVDRAPAFRDHSWGPRDWLSPTYWRQAIGYFDDGECFSASEIGVSETEAIRTGWRLQDGSAGYLTGSRIESGYRGEPANEYAYTVSADGTEGLDGVDVRGVPLASVPLRHRAEGSKSSSEVQRISQVLSTFERNDGRVGWGWTDFWQRLPEGEFPSQRGH